MVLRRQPLEEVGEADWDLQMDVNLKSTFFLARTCAERMAATGVDGRIVDTPMLRAGLAGETLDAILAETPPALTRTPARA